MMRGAILPVLFCLICALTPPEAEAAREIGSMAAVNRDVDGTPPNAPTRSLLIGDRLIQNERLVSSPVGSGQLLFIDQTSLTISANSDITLDKYVYDPDRKTGEIGLSVAKGVLRLVGGRITKQGEAVIRTPSATIGIRGGIAVIAVENGVSRVMHIAGEYTRIDAGGEILTLSRTNAFATVQSKGQPEYQGVASEQTIAGLFNRMQGGGGGRSAPVTREETQAEGGGVARVNSAERTVVSRPPVSTRGERPAEDQSAETEQRRLGSGNALQDDRQDEVRQRAREDRDRRDAGDGQGDRPQRRVARVDLDPEPETPFLPEPVGTPLPRTAELEPPILPPPGGDPTPPPPTFEDPTSLLTPELPPLEPETLNPFAGFIGGGVFVSDAEPAFDDFGAVVPLPASQNFTSAGEGGDFIDIREGSIIGAFPSGGELRLPVGDGVFALNPAETASPFGELIGFGIGNAASGFHAYHFRTVGGELGAAIFAEPGPTQLAQFDNISSDYQVIPFRILGDGGLVDPAIPTPPFLSPSATAAFAGAGEHRLFFLSEPNSPIAAGPGPGFASFSGTRALLPVFSIAGQGAAQSYALYVGSTDVLNSGDGTPTFPMIARGSYRLSGELVANGLQQTIGPIALGVDFGPGATVFGANDDYLVLSNDAPFLLDDVTNDPMIGASFAEDVSFEEGFFETFGNIQVAEREGVQSLPLATRIEIGASPLDFAVDTGLTTAATIPADEKRLLSSVFSSGVGFVTSTSEKVALRTTGAESGLGAFNLPDARGAISLVMDEADAGASILGASLHFGGQRSAIISDRVFGLRDNPDPSEFATEIGAGPLFAENTVTAFDTSTAFGIPPDLDGQAAFRGALVSHGLADVADLYPAGTDLEPEYLAWGWWTGQFRFDAFDPTPLAGGDLQFSLGTWVGGDITASVPTSGVATFNGPVTLNYIDAAGADYIDGGRFSLSYDFGAGSGAATFTDLVDLPTINVPVDDLGRSPGPHYEGSALIAGGDVAVSGNFFDGPVQNDARATAGGIRINRPGIGARGVGTFWGER